jgi:1-acyl-sn-glycerol-3-phosphate acyltransferase
MAAQFIMEGNPILMFPEGTRSADGNFQTPRGGLGYLAARLRCPVVPVHVRGTFEVFPRNSKWPKPGKISARIGEPMKWKDCKDNDAYLIITKEVMNKIEDLSRLP